MISNVLNKSSNRRKEERTKTRIYASSSHLRYSCFLVGVSILLSCYLLALEKSPEEGEEVEEGKIGAETGCGW